MKRRRSLVVLLLIPANAWISVVTRCTYRQLNTDLWVKDSASVRAEADGEDSGDSSIFKSVRNFFSPPPDEPEPEEPEESGFFSGWFKRKSDQDAKSQRADRKTKIVRQKKEAEKQSKKDIKARKETSKKIAKATAKATAEKSSSRQLRKPTDKKPVKSDQPSTSATGDDTVAAGNSTGPLSLVQNFFSFGGGEGAVKEEWVPVFPKTRIDPGELVPVTVAGIDLLVIASRDGRKLHCMANSCPHLGTPLETGVLVRLPVESKNTPEPPQPAEQQSRKDLGGNFFTEMQVSDILQQDGLEECVVCPLHRTAFALESGEVRGPWCPYPPVLGAIVGQVKAPTSAAIFDVRTRGKNVEVRINSLLSQADAKAKTKK